MNQGFFLLYFLVWGSAVVADLDQFSKADVPCICLSRSCRYGTHFTTCLGFAITTVSQHSNGGSLVA
jgi:hypothetical protein